MNGREAWMMDGGRGEEMGEGEGGGRRKKKEGRGGADLGAGIEGKVSIDRKCNESWTFDGFERKKRRGRKGKGEGGKER
jgi:hypothetical protein